MRGVHEEKSGRRGVAALALLTVTGVAAAAVWLPSPASWTGFQESLGSSAVPAPGTAAEPADDRTPSTSTFVPQPSLPPADRPTPTRGTTRLATAPPAPAGGGSHAFALVQDNGVTPIAYDPCRPIHYVMRPDGIPPGGEEMVHAAAARLSEVTGLQFVYDGASDEPLTEDREPYQPDRYGDRWAPVLVAFQTEAENPGLAGDVVGRAGSVAVEFWDSPRVYVSGIVSLDGGQFPEILAGYGGRETATAIVLHEFAHLVGLNHVDDPTQLMNPETVYGVTDFATGDLTGLARLGRGPCAPLL
jgi:hypothetical protein